MWTLISKELQIDNIKVNEPILKHPSDDQPASSNPSGQEDNSYTYKVVLRTLDELELEYLVNGASLGTIVVASMKRKVNYDQLLNGTWWINI